MVADARAMSSNRLKKSHATCLHTDEHTKQQEFRVIRAHVTNVTGHLATGSLALQRVASAPLSQSVACCADARASLEMLLAALLAADSTAIARERRELLD